jgi:zinc/manganese transport system substrate-binding protein
MTRRSISRRAALSAATALALPGLASAQAGGGRIVASFSLLADMVRQVAPPGFDVQALVGADADAHVFEPRPADARRLAEAELVVVNGLGFEGWIDRLVKASGYRGAVVVATREVTPRRVGGGADPHAWQDLANARRYVVTLAKALAERWPAHAATVRDRAAAYDARLAALDAEVRAKLDQIPREQRRVISSHDAFGYFGAAYGVDFLAAQGWNTHSEPSAAAVSRLIQQIRVQRVRALFIENISDPRLVQRIAQDSGARVGGTLFSDALSGPGGPAATYLDLFAHNARTIAAALVA